MYTKAIKSVVRLAVQNSQDHEKCVDAIEYLSTLPHSEENKKAINSQCALVETLLNEHHRIEGAYNILKNIKDVRNG